MKISYCFIVFVLTIFCHADLNADIYTWTDENGVKHYSNAPPEDAKNAEVVFPEYQYDRATDQKRFEMEQDEWSELINRIEKEERQQKLEEKRKAEEAARNRPPTQEERTEAEKERLEQKIAELEEKPLEYFGSQKNKRVRIGYYRYRLETLMQDPDKYFAEPVAFEGNVKPVQEEDTAAETSQEDHAENESGGFSD